MSPRSTLHLALLLAVSAIASGPAHAQTIAPAGSVIGPGVCALTPLAFGAAPGTGSLSATGETDCWRFSAAAGDRVRVRVAGTSVRAEIAGCGPAAAEVTCTLGASGGHTVFVRGSGGYAITVQRLGDPLGCSALAYEPSTRTGAITAGETECWRLTGAAGDRMRVRLVTAAAALAPRVEVLRPDGTTRCGPAGAADSTCTLDAGGTHTILVRDVGMGSGGYSLSAQRLGDPVGCSSKQYGAYAIRGSVVTTGETDCWRFSGVPGPVRAAAVGTSGTVAPAVEVLRPDGTTRCTATTDRDATCRLDVQGTHTILVRDAAGGTRTGDYRIALQRLADPLGCSPLAYGTGAADGSLATAGESDCWRLETGAGVPVRVRAIGASGSPAPVVELLDGTGTTRCAPASACTTGGGGTHTILVRDSAGTRSGDYRISIQRLEDPVGCSGDPGHAGGDGYVVPAGIDCWRYDGDDGDLVRFRLIDGDWDWDPRIEVLRPDGSTACQQTSGDGLTCELDADGEHTILVQSASGTRYGGYRVSAIQLDGPSYECPNLATSPSAHTAYILADAEVDCYTAWAPEAGARSLRVEATSGTLEPVVEVLKPDGSLRCRQTAPDGWFDCYGDIYEYQRILVYDASGIGHGNYEIDRR